MPPRRLPKKAALRPSIRPTGSSRCCGTSRNFRCVSWHSEAEEFMMRNWRELAALCFFMGLAAAKSAAAAEIKILSGSAIEPAMAELIPKFEQAAGHKVSFDFDGTIGGMTDRVRNGEVADVLSQCWRRKPKSSRAAAPISPKSA